MSKHSRANVPPAITLYDIPGPSPQPWAPNIWRVSTVWVEFPDVQSTLHSIGAPPSSVRSDGRPVYTLPVLVDPGMNPTSPTILSNPNTISEYLESTYPSSPVFPPGSRAVQILFVHYIQEVFAKPLLPIMVPLSHQQLPGRSQDYLRPHGGLYSRSGSSGQPLPPGPQREQAWLAVKEQFDFLASILSKNIGDGDGTVVMGYEVSYGDFALCSVLIWIQRMSPNDGWPRIKSWNGGRWERLWERCRPYMSEH
ncbi:hypothetical protein AAF712_001678 [Marasmius tenuissimus]|uniref:Glutathione S-transferase UstS-like C-terminal domain-containing protein n=1 Tax=Marasmius tenuissimus TaxID=585030 RepID=A0ABR3AC87_9AGAR